jgi:cardiolipin synthase A/B
MKHWQTAFLSSLATLGAVVVGSNLRASGQRNLRHKLQPDYGVEDEQFLRAIGCLLPPPIRRGHRVTAYQNGDQILPAMLEAIRSAQRSITLETFIYWSGRTGREFAEALAGRARAGVRVHVSLDWIGSDKADPHDVNLMTSAGVQIERYHKPRALNLGRINERSHRKILVVDGKVGFTGGVGIADEWTGDAKDPDHWRDSHFKVEGPAVAQLQAAFMDNWLKVRPEVLHDERYFPPLDEAGDMLAQVFISSPREGIESVRLMYLLSIACARRSIRLGSAYFVPDGLALEHLIGAARRGVRVQIIVPGRHIDTRIVRCASRSLWGPLLRAGVEIHEYVPTMYHVKLLVVDDLFVSVGSTNFDNRSFRFNDECNLNVYDRTFALEQAAVFDADLERCRKMTYQQWAGRPLLSKAQDAGASMLQGQL